MKSLKAFGLLLYGGLGAVLGVLGFLAILFIMPVFMIASGFVTGVFVEWVFGSYINDGINMLFKTELVKGDLPIITSALFFIGYLLGIRKPSNTTVGAKSNTRK